MISRRRLVRVLGAGVAAALLATGTPPAPATALSGGTRDAGDRTPIFDFTDATYRAGGIDPAKLVGRRSGTDGLSVLDTAPDAAHRGVRTTFTLPAYDTSGKRYFFTVLSDLAPEPFTADAAGARARQLAEASPVYVFPARGADPTGIGDNRQADMIDLRHGYFSNNPLGLWVHVFVNWTPRAFDTAAGRKALTALRRTTGTALDGTPIIKTQSQLDTMKAKGLVTLTRRATTETGRYFVCPVFKDPRRGALRPDSFLATVRRPDGTALPAEQAFVDDFESLRTTGEPADD